MFAAIDGYARLLVIELGHINEDHAEVLGGLADGDRVVLHPSDRIADGSRIIEREIN